MIVALLALSLMAAPAYALGVKQFVNNFATGSSADHEEVIAMVYNADSVVTYSTGDVLAWDTTNDDGRSVTRVNRFGQPVAGVAAGTIPPNSWGEMLVYGYHSAVKVRCEAGYNVTVGYPLYAYGDSTITNNAAATYWGYAGQGGVTGITVVPRTPFATVLDEAATATTGTVEAIVDCL